MSKAHCKDGDFIETNKTKSQKRNQEETLAPEPFSLPERLDVSPLLLSMLPPEGSRNCAMLLSAEALPAESTDARLLASVSIMRHLLTPWTSSQPFICVSAS